MDPLCLPKYRITMYKKNEKCIHSFSHVLCCSLASCIILLRLSLVMFSTCSLTSCIVLSQVVLYYHQLHCSLTSCIVLSPVVLFSYTLCCSLASCVVLLQIVFFALMEFHKGSPVEQM